MDVSVPAQEREQLGGYDNNPSEKSRLLQSTLVAIRQGPGSEEKENYSCSCCIIR